MPCLVSISSSRADVGILEPVWRALANQPYCELHVILTGMHCAATAHASIPIPDGAKVHHAGADLGGHRSGAQASDAMASMTRDIGAILADIQPDAILVVGDRLDMLPAAVAALPFNIVIVHLHGGEITEGAIDDRVRHALSKLAHFHCVSSTSARDRLIAMGEEDWRIEVTGAPGLDTLLTVTPMGADEFAAAIEMEAVDGLRLVTVHPETNADDPLAPLDTVLDALKARPARTLFTAPNSDPGGAEARNRIEKFVDGHVWAGFRDTLGATLYANALRHASVMIGNSSSGLIEAGLFGLPVVNVGDRQAGRDRGPNVIDVASDTASIVAVLDRLGQNPRRFESFSPYGGGRSGPRVASVVCGLPERQKLLRKRWAGGALHEPQDMEVAQC